MNADAAVAEGPRSVRILESSRRRAVVVQDAAEASARIDRPVGMWGNRQRLDCSIPDALMVALEMIVLGVLAQCTVQHPRTDRNELGEALVLDRSDEAFSVSIHIR